MLRKNNKIKWDLIGVAALLATGFSIIFWGLINISMSDHQIQERSRVDPNSEVNLRIREVQAQEAMVKMMEEFAKQQKACDKQ